MLTLVKEVINYSDVNGGWEKQLYEWDSENFMVEFLDHVKIHCSVWTD
jgi:hypothetical protein